MPFSLDSRRKSAATLERAYPGATFLDVTSRGPDPWVRFSPFFPHGGIPVPMSNETAQSVEGIWQGLKVFDTADVDPTRFAVSSMSGLKRTTRRFGAVRGHRAGVTGRQLLSYLDARLMIYLPAYRFVLEHRLANELAELHSLGERTQVVLLDYETNARIDDLSRPLSHASLVIAWLTNAWPARDEMPGPLP
ncbi:MAG: hypothetical protein HOW73_09530 [Polyangiaceae bacterium]|nr:hypothetical protein [Polyangiaceae bacterium]